MFDIGSEKISFLHRDLIWTFNRPTNHVWDDYERRKSKLVEIKSKTIESDVDDMTARFRFFEETATGVFKLDGSPALDLSNGWIDKVPPKVKKELINYFTEVQTIRPELQEIQFGATTQEITIEAWQYWKETKSNGQDEDWIHHLKRIRMTHTFGTPTNEHEREFKKISQGKTVIDRRTRGAAQITRSDLAGYRKLYDDLIINATGYSIDGVEVFDKDKIDSVHKMVALDGLFAEEGTEETKN
jgi:hypothetical protein